MKNYLVEKGRKTDFLLYFVALFPCNSVVSRDNSVLSVRLDLAHISATSFCQHLILLNGSYTFKTSGNNSKAFTRKGAVIFRRGSLTKEILQAIQSFVLHSFRANAYSRMRPWASVGIYICVCVHVHMHVVCVCVRTCVEWGLSSTRSDDHIPCVRKWSVLQIASAREQ